MTGGPDRRPSQGGRQEGTVRLARTKGHRQEGAGKRGQADPAIRTYAEGPGNRGSLRRTEARSAGAEGRGDRSKG